jgi:uncharacterized protein (TIGR03435 family)
MNHAARRPAGLRQQTGDVYTMGMRALLRAGFMTLIAWAAFGQSGEPLPKSGESLPKFEAIFDAVSKQLGLKLESQKRPLPVLVIDRIER